MVVVAQSWIIHVTFFFKAVNFEAYGRLTMLPSEPVLKSLGARVCRFTSGVEEGDSNSCLYESLEYTQMIFLKTLPKCTESFQPLFHPANQSHRCRHWQLSEKETKTKETK